MQSPPQELFPPADAREPYRNTCVSEPLFLYSLTEFFGVQALSLRISPISRVSRESFKIYIYILWTDLHFSVYA